MHRFLLIFAFLTVFAGGNFCTINDLYAAENAHKKISEKPLTLQTHRLHTKPLKIWGAALSPYVRKVCVVCLEKKISYQLNETLPLNLLVALHQEIPVGFREASVLGKIPAINDNGYTLSDSAVIAAYLEKRVAKPSLYACDAENYARILWLEKYVDDEMAKVLHTKIFVERVVKPGLLQQPCDETVVQKAIEEELPPFFDYIEKALAESTWPSNHTGLTVADIALGSHIVDLHMSQVEIDTKRWPLLAQHVTKILSRPSFIKILEKK